MSRRSTIFIPVHLVWATKDRQKTITETIEQQVFEILRRTVRSLGAVPAAVGGYRDHVHVAAVFTDSFVLREFMGVLKGHSSSIIREELDPQFKWQRGFAAFGFGLRGMTPLCRYINDQKARHERRRTYKVLERVEPCFEHVDPEVYIKSLL